MITGAGGGGFLLLYCESAHQPAVTEALESMGDVQGAEQATARAAVAARSRRIDSAADLTEAVRAMIVRARIQGQPARDFQTMLDLLARAHQQLDRLYWPARLAEAELLYSKDERGRAAEAAQVPRRSLNAENAKRLRKIHLPRAPVRERPEAPEGREPAPQ